MKRLVASGALIALSVTGCGNGPIQAGAAAVVGDTRITTTDLDQLVSRGLADPTAQQNVGTDKASFERVVLRRLIDHDVLVSAAAKEHVTVTAGDVLAARARIADQVGGEEGLQTEALKAGISLRDLDDTVRDVALRDALADKLTASIPVPASALAQAYRQNITNYDQVHSAHILVSTNALAQAILKQVQADPTRFAALAEQHSTDPGSKTKGGDLGFLGRGVLDKTFEAAIFSHKPGTFLVVHTQFGFHVIHVIAHRIISLAEATPDLRRGLLSQQRDDAVQTRLLETAHELGVRVNPRFGMWDPRALDVVPITGGAPVTSQSPRPGDSPSAPPPAGSAP